MEALHSITFEQLPGAVAEMKEDIKFLLSSTLKIMERVNNPSEVKPSNQPVDIDRAAAMTGLAKNTIYRYSRQGQIPCYKRGKRLMFYEHELEDWVRQGRHKSIDERVKEAGCNIIPRVSNPQ